MQVRNEEGFPVGGDRLSQRGLFMPGSEDFDALDDDRVDWDVLVRSA